MITRLHTYDISREEFFIRYFYFLFSSCHCVRIHISTFCEFSLPIVGTVELVGWCGEKIPTGQRYVCSHTSLVIIMVEVQTLSGLELSCFVSPAGSWRQSAVKFHVNWRNWRNCGNHNSLDIGPIHFKFCVPSSSSQVLAAERGNTVCVKRFGGRRHRIAHRNVQRPTQNTRNTSKETRTCMSTWCLCHRPNLLPCSTDQPTRRHARVSIILQYKRHQCHSSKNCFRFSH